MSEEWRSFIYPLGFLAGFFFGARFLIQWIKSEIQQKSIIPPSFWILSVIGNALAYLHAFFQVQFHICIIQMIGAILSWRNLNLLEDKEKQLSFSSVLKILFLGLFFTIIGFILQIKSYSGELSWFRIPVTPWSETTEEISSFWHFIGFIGYALFSSRFWVQWWIAERENKSFISPSFWWISIIGAFLSLTYFIKINDLVNIIGPSMGLVPYIRNLFLIQKEKVEYER